MARTGRHGAATGLRARATGGAEAGGHRSQVASSLPLSQSTSVIALPAPQLGPPSMSLKVAWDMG